MDSQIEKIQEVDKKKKIPSPCKVLALGNLISLKLRHRIVPAVLYYDIVPTVATSTRLSSSHPRKLHGFVSMCLLTRLRGLGLFM